MVFPSLDTVRSVFTAVVGTVVAYWVALERTRSMYSNTVTVEVPLSIAINPLLPGIATILNWFCSLLVNGLPDNTDVFSRTDSSFCCLSDNLTSLGDTPDNRDTITASSGSKSLNPSDLVVTDVTSPTSRSNF